MKHTKTNIAAAFALLFVAPLVAEFLLGNLSWRMLPALIVLAPMYGGAALLIREVARRNGRRWPSILLLGAAYTLIEEAFVTQSLFNPDFMNLHMHLLDPAFVPALGIGAWWTLLMFNLHTFWSVSVSIALVEALVPSEISVPWLSKAGESVVAVVFLLGLIGNAAFALRGDHFVASYLQFLTAGLICVGLISLAFRVPFANVRTDKGAVPGWWFTGTVALLAGSAVLVTPNRWNWGAAAILVALDCSFLWFVSLFSRREKWTLLHTFSLAAGGALAYGLHAFFQTPVVGGAHNHIGNVVFLAAAIALIVAGARNTSNFEKRLVSPLG